MSEVIGNQNSILYAAYLNFVALGYAAAVKVSEGRTPTVEDRKTDDLAKYFDAWEQNADLTDEQKESVLYALLKLAQPLTTEIMATLQPFIGNQIIYEQENPPVSIVGLPYRVYAPRGYWSFVGNAFPTTGGGTGAAGAIEEGNTFEINGQGNTPGGQFVPVGAVIRALQDGPGQTDGNWHVSQS